LWIVGDHYLFEGELYGLGFDLFEGNLVRLGVEFESLCGASPGEEVDRGAEGELSRLDIPGYV
jgi:hypothetical protein